MKAKAIFQSQMNPIHQICSKNKFFSKIRGASRQKTEAMKDSDSSLFSQASKRKKGRSGLWVRLDSKVPNISWTKTIPR